jgi:hypothetical protein
MRTIGAFPGSVGVAMGVGAGCCCSVTAGVFTFSAVVLSELLHPEALQKTKNAAQPRSVMESLFMACCIEAAKVMKECVLRIPFSTPTLVKKGTCFQYEK